MNSAMKEITILSKGHRDIIDITKKVQSIVDDSSVKCGLCNIFIQHTTAALTVNENADQSVKEDILNRLEILAPKIPNEKEYLHTEGNSDAHIKTSLLSQSITIPIHNGKLALGVWQGVMLCEFDGPRNRKVLVTIIQSKQ
ncbi:MAG: secondary thiamine-phosphate synthase enzyme YjbQ [Candidatus Woesearchaeota archaeon]